MYDHNGDPVGAEDVLSSDELADYYRGRGWPLLPPGAVHLPWPDTAEAEAAS